MLKRKTARPLRNRKSEGIISELKLSSIYERNVYVYFQGSGKCRFSKQTSLRAILDTFLMSNT